MQIDHLSRVTSACGTASSATRLSILLLKNPRLVVIHDLYLDLAPDNLERRAEHVRITYIVDHHVVVTRYDYPWRDCLNNAGCLHRIEIPPPPAHPHAPHVDAAPEQRIQQPAIRCLTS